MIPVELSEEADADLVEILSYGTEAFGEAQAESYVKSFDDTFDLISRHPRAGALHDAVRPPVRSLPHGSHRISTMCSRTGRWFSACFTRRWMWRGIFEDGAAQIILGLNSDSIHLPTCERQLIKGKCICHCSTLTQAAPAYFPRSGFSNSCITPPRIWVRCEAAVRLLGAA